MTILGFWAGGVAPALGGDRIICLKVKARLPLSRLVHIDVLLPTISLTPGLLICLTLFSREAKQDMGKEIARTH